MTKNHKSHLNLRCFFANMRILTLVCDSNHKKGALKSPILTPLSQNRARYMGACQRS